MPPTPPETPQQTIEQVRAADRLRLSTAAAAYREARLNVGITRTTLAYALAQARVHDVVTPAERDRLTGLSSEQRRRYEIDGLALDPAAYEREIAKQLTDADTEGDTHR